MGKLFSLLFPSEDVWTWLVFENTERWSFSSKIFQYYQVSSFRTEGSAGGRDRHTQRCNDWAFKPSGNQWDNRWHWTISLLWVILLIHSTDLHQSSRDQEIKQKSINGIEKSASDPGGHFLNKSTPSYLNGNYTKYVGNTEPDQRSEGENIFLHFLKVPFFPLRNNSPKWSTKIEYLPGKAAFKNSVLWWPKV